MKKCDICGCEKPEHFEGFCSAACEQLFIAKTYNSFVKWPKGRNQVNHFMIHEMFDNKCARCSYNEVLDIHHITPLLKGGMDYIENLIVFCPNCHALYHRHKITLDEVKHIRANVYLINIFIDVI